MMLTNETTHLQVTIGAGWFALPVLAHRKHAGSGPHVSFFKYQVGSWIQSGGGDAMDSKR